MSVRIAHASDIHWLQIPPLGRLAGKRMLGGLNLLLGRGRHFDRQVQRGLVQHLIDLAPDVVVLSGDLTQSALEDEFAAAREDLQPLLDALPVFIVPGNHDLYTPGARDSRRIHGFFGPWMHLDGPIARLDLGEITLLGLDPNRPGLLSSGLLPQDQLDALREVLANPALADRTAVLVIHYPLLDEHGATYDHFSHGLRNAADLIALLRAAPKTPTLLVHGHDHHAYNTTLDAPAGNVEIYCCGSSGYAHAPHSHRVARMNVYELEAGRLIGVERYAHDGQGWGRSERD